MESDRQSARRGGFRAARRVVGVTPAVRGAVTEGQLGGSAPFLLP
jgi:hypothetical protein